MALTAEDIKRATLLREVPVHGDQDIVKVFSTKLSSVKEPGYGFKTVRKRKQVFFFYDGERFPNGAEDEVVGKAVGALLLDIADAPEKFLPPAEAPAAPSAPVQEMETAAARAGSFTAAWPASHPAPASLAAAGLYFSPTAAQPDRTVCYACGCELHNWSSDDEPLREHSRWNPKCPLILQASKPAAGAAQAGSVLSSVKKLWGWGSAANGGRAQQAAQPARTSLLPASSEKDAAKRWQEILQGQLANAGGASVVVPRHQLVAAAKVLQELEQSETPPEPTDERVVFTALHAKMAEELEVVNQRFSERVAALAAAEKEVGSLVDVFFAKNAEQLDLINTRVKQTELRLVQAQRQLEGQWKRASAARKAEAAAVAQRLQHARRLRDAVTADVERLERDHAALTLAAPEKEQGAPSS